MIPAAPPADQRASIAVDLGAESCRVSLLRWHAGQPHIELVHRFPNAPVAHADGTLRWPLRAIEDGIDEGMRRAATLAPESVRSVGVDGWAVDYVRLNANLHPLADPFCYRDERTLASEEQLHRAIAPDRLRQITGIERMRINTLYQLHADRLAALPPGARWLNLPEYMLTRWGAEPVSEITNASHTQMLELSHGGWSPEIIAAAGLDSTRFPRLVPPGTALGRMTGPLAQLPAFAATELIAPACHDTASAIAGIPAEGDDWGYISSGTWSLVGTLLPRPENGPAARADNYTNLGAAGGAICFHKNVNGMWLLKQCVDAWATAGASWDIPDLAAAADALPRPAFLLNVDDPELLLVGGMLHRIDNQLRARGLPLLDHARANAPAVANLIFHSLAARYAEIFRHIQHHTGKQLRRVFVVGGGSRNALLLRLTAQATGLEVLRGSAESSTLGNFALQLAALEKTGHCHWAALLQTAL